MELRGTTILAVRHKGHVALIGDRAGDHGAEHRYETHRQESQADV